MPRVKGLKLSFDHPNFPNFSKNIIRCKIWHWGLLWSNFSSCIILQHLCAAWVPLRRLHYLLKIMSSSLAVFPVYVHRFQLCFIYSAKGMMVPLQAKPTTPAPSQETVASGNDFRGVEAHPAHALRPPVCATRQSKCAVPWGISFY